MSVVRTTLITIAVLAVAVQTTASHWKAGTTGARAAGGAVAAGRAGHVVRIVVLDGRTGGQAVDLKDGAYITVTGWWPLLNQRIELWKCLCGEKRERLARLARGNLMVQSLKFKV